MNWKRRYRQWRHVLEREGRSGGRVPWLTMVLAVLSGPVPRSVWRARMRTCANCPLYSVVESSTGRLPVCRSTHPAMRGQGCGCYLPFTALTANPYGHGCYGRLLDSELGWPAHVFRSRLAEAWAVIDFLRGK